MKGTQWVIKTPRLKCRCGATIHMENRGKWRIIYDSEPTCATPSYTLSLLSRDSEPPPIAKDDSEG